jgi:hypothetical protein
VIGRKMKWKQRIISWCIALPFIIICNLIVWLIINQFIEIEGWYELPLMILTAMPFSMSYFLFIEDRLFKIKPVLR